MSGSILDQLHHTVSGHAQLEPPESPWAGQPKRLVFLHGVMGFASNWRLISREFESEYQVLLYDQRGHGRSFRPPTGYAPEDYAGDLNQILTELNWPSVDLVGHSMGGRVAFTFARLWPERVRRLVIEDIGPVMQPDAVSMITQILDFVPVPFADRESAKRFFAQDFLARFGDGRSAQGLGAFLYANLAESDGGGLGWRFFEPGVRESLKLGRSKERWDDISALTRPTLLVRGELSRDLPQDVFEQTLRANPRIRGAVIQGAGHWVHSERPREFIQALRAFLTTRDGFQ